METKLSAEQVRSSLWADVPFVVFDLETTGLNENDRILELGAVLMSGSKVVESFRSLVNPMMPIPEAVSAIHGIRDEDVKDAPKFRDVAPDFYRFLFRGLPIVSHNLNFDARFLAKQIDPTRWPKDTFSLCTLVEAKKKGHTKKGEGKLNALAEFYSIPHEKEHAALDDAIVAGRLVRWLVGSYSVGNCYTKLMHEWVL